MGWPWAASGHHVSFTESPCLGLPWWTGTHPWSSAARVRAKPGITHRDTEAQVREMPFLEAAVPQQQLQGKGIPQVGLMASPAASPHPHPKHPSPSSLVPSKPFQCHFGGHSPRAVGLEMLAQPFSHPEPAPCAKAELNWKNTHNDLLWNVV